MKSAEEAEHIYLRSLKSYPSLTLWRYKKKKKQLESAFVIHRSLISGKALFF